MPTNREYPKYLAGVYIITTTSGSQTRVTIASREADFDAMFARLKNLTDFSSVVYGK